MGIKKMKTRVGLVQHGVPPHLAQQCLAYLVVHELAHLLVRHHDDRFTVLMDRHLPRWQLARRTLNAASLAHETWE